MFGWSGGVRGGWRRETGGGRLEEGEWKKENGRRRMEEGR